MSDAFDKAQVDVKTLTKRPGNDDLLQLYACFKQATQGDVTGKRPGMLKVEARAKFDAWDKLKGVDQAQAEQRYIDKVAALLQSHQ